VIESPSPPTRPRRGRILDDNDTGPPKSSSKKFALNSVWSEIGETELLCAADGGNCSDRGFRSAGARMPIEDAHPCRLIVLHRHRTTLHPCTQSILVGIIPHYVGHNTGAM
jgi:hypothetical protein